MNTNINKFSSKRMLRFMAADMYNRRVMLILLLALAILCTTAFYLLTYKYLTVRMSVDGLDSQYMLTSGLDNLFMVAWSAISLAILLYSSSVFTSFFKRGYAAQNMMLPVSRSEKFISRILNLVIVNAAIIGVVWLISTIYAIYLGVDISFSPFNIVIYQNNTTVIMTEGLSFMIEAVLSIIMLIAMYFFGASFWRKLHFIKTSAVILVVLIIMIQFDLDLRITNEVPAWIWGLATIVFLVLAWLRFRKIQIKG